MSAQTPATKDAARETLATEPLSFLFYFLFRHFFFFVEFRFFFHLFQVFFKRFFNDSLSLSLYKLLF
jgi:hypothetical protein